MPSVDGEEQASSLGAAGASRLEIYVSEGQDGHVVRLVGELDLVDAGRVREVLMGVAGSTVDLDLTGLRFVDAAGVGAIVAAEQRIRRGGHALHVSGAQGIVRRVFEITALDHLLRD